jgi:hypothetical protein
VEPDGLAQQAIDKVGDGDGSGRGTVVTQSQQVVKDDQLEAALTSLEGHIRRRPQLLGGVRQPSFLGINPGQGSQLVDEEAKAVLAAQRQ